MKRDYRLDQEIVDYGLFDCRPVGSSGFSMKLQILAFIAYEQLAG